MFFQIFVSVSKKTKKYCVFDPNSSYFDLKISSFCEFSFILAIVNYNRQLEPDTRMFNRERDFFFFVLFT